MYKQSCPERWMWTLFCPQRILRCINVLAHVSQRRLHVHVYFNYYQLFSITLNHFLFSKANYFRYFPQKKFICHWLQLYSHYLGRILRPPGLFAPVELYRVLQTQMGLQFKFNDSTEIQWNFLNLFSSALASRLK